MSKITIRAFQNSDWEDIADVFQMPICQRGTMQMPYQSRDDIKQRLENPSQEMHRLVAIDESTGTAIGIIGLHLSKGRRKHVAGIGMAVHDDYQNQGVGTQLMQAALELAEKWLDLKRIELQVYTDNKGAIRLYEKFGFVHEGTHRAFAIRDGKFVDAHAMARVSRTGDEQE